MAKKQTTETWTVSYSCRDKNTHEDVRCVNMSWENRPVEEIVDSINTWLIAVGYPQLTVTEKK